MLKTFPALWIQVLLTILLGLLAIQSARKGWELHKKEEAQKAKQMEDDPNVHIVDAPTGSNSPNAKLNKSTITAADRSTIKVTDTEIEEDDTMNYIKIGDKKFKLG